MTGSINEQLSSLVDGELPDEEREFLQRSLAKNCELRETWWRYNLIRDAIREDLPEFINTSADMAYVRHQESDSLDSVVKASVLRRTYRPFVGIMLAASVAMLAVVGVMYNGGQLATPLFSQIMASFQMAEQQPSRNNFVAVPRNGWQSTEPAVVFHLNEYLVDHSRYAGFGSARGIISYSRVAGYDKSVSERELQEYAR